MNERTKQIRNAILGTVAFVAVVLSGVAVRTRIPQDPGVTDDPWERAEALNPLFGVKANINVVTVHANEGLCDDWWVTISVGPAWGEWDVELEGVPKEWPGGTEIIKWETYGVSPDIGDTVYACFNGCGTSWGKLTIIEPLVLYLPIAFGG